MYITVLNFIKTFFFAIPRFSFLDLGARAVLERQAASDKDASPYSLTASLVCPLVLFLVLDPDIWCSIFCIRHASRIAWVDEPHFALTHHIGCDRCGTLSPTISKLGLGFGFPVMCLF
ncbi:hypothetical protein AVEN_235071-1 [Araneus ventricosus]|uniref:Uncharacterized protein n=1 Tax=Araneus ventricosus TaxID=182803 RepID=A0A4Y2PYN8_ARAVE|nr:hypothetical protein AVEN_235071-1 [Araneus ventricosus]